MERRICEDMLTKGDKPSPRALCTLLGESQDLAPVFNKALNLLGSHQVLSDILTSMDKFTTGTEVRADNGQPRTTTGILLKGWKTGKHSKKIFKKTNKKWLCTYLPSELSITDLKNKPIKNTNACPGGKSHHQGHSVCYLERARTWPLSSPRVSIFLGHVCFTFLHI